MKDRVVCGVQAVLIHEGLCGVQAVLIHEGLCGVQAVLIRRATSTSCSWSAH